MLLLILLYRSLRAPRELAFYLSMELSFTLHTSETQKKLVSKSLIIPSLGYYSCQIYYAYANFSSRQLVRSTFQKARSASPSVIFFDEIDAIVGKRNLGDVSGGGSGDSVQERVLSMLLNEMDGVESATSVLVVVSVERSVDDRGFGLGPRVS